MGRLWSRILVWITAHLLLGVVTAVLVAWVLALWLPHASVRKRFNVVQMEDRSFVGIHEVRRPGMLRRSWRPERFSGAPDWYSELAAGALMIPATVPREDRKWGRLPAALSGRSLDIHLAEGMEDARGWPRLALWCGIDPAAVEGLNGGEPVWGGVGVTRLPTKAGRFRALPFMPIWPGFLVNTGVYAACWAVLGAGAMVGRRAIRALCHRCARCGYDVRGSGRGVCPECGRRRSRRTAAGAPASVTF